MPTKMKTKDSLRRKRGRRKEKDKRRRGRWTTVTEERGTRPLLSQHERRVYGLTHTHTHAHSGPLTFCELLHKSWRGPSVPP